MTLRKVTKNRSLFPNHEEVFKLMYLALRNISKRWTMPIKNWSAALNQFGTQPHSDGHAPRTPHRRTPVQRDEEDGSLQESEGLMGNELQKPTTFSTTVRF
jgi:hypothetical protein